VVVQSTELEPAAGEDVGRMDIAFYAPAYCEDYYFCVEAKRLNVIKDGAVRSYASEYVRFGRYAAISACSIGASGRPA